MICCWMVRAPGYRRLPHLRREDLRGGHRPEVGLGHLVRHRRGRRRHRDAQPTPTGRSAATRTTNDVSGCRAAKRRSDARSEAAPTIAVIRSPTRIAAYPASGELIANEGPCDRHDADLGVAEPVAHLHEDGARKTPEVREVPAAQRPMGMTKLRRRNTRGDRAGRQRCGCARRHDGPVIEPIQRTHAPADSRPIGCPRLRPEHQHGHRQRRRPRPHPVGHANACIASARSEGLAGPSQ